MGAEVEPLPNDDCPLTKQSNAIWVAHICGRGLEFVAGVA
jgi:hypothetical protein